MTTAGEMQTAVTPLAAVRFRVLGDGDLPWLVICHGMALDHRDLLPFAQTLADKWRVLLWDMPGHGQSAPLSTHFSLDAMARILHHLLTSAGIKRAVLLGFSFGGMVAQALLRDHPDKVRALVAYGCFAPFSQPAPTPRWTTPLVTRMTFGVLSWPQIKADFASRCALRDDARNQVLSAMEPLNKTAFMDIATALLASFNPDPAFRIDVPLLLIRGSEDSNAALLEPAFAALRRLSCDTHEALVLGAGHCAHLDSPDAFAEPLAAFLERLRLEPQ